MAELRKDLDGAILLLLVEHNNIGLTSRQLAKMINDRKLFVKSNNSPVTPLYIDTRYRHFKNIFKYQNGKYYLLNSK